jgi:hypothetical protein
MFINLTTRSVRRKNREAPYCAISSSPLIPRPEGHRHLPQHPMLETP